MQYALACALSTLLPAIHRLISEEHGPLPIYHRLDPVSQLILSLIGARTHGEVSLEVFVGLRQRFADWRDLAGLTENALARCLQPVTYAERKATQLRESLRMIERRSGSLNLIFLKQWPVEDAQTWLMGLPGVGPKVSAAILNFSTLRKRVLVVDCHHFRVAKRLGLLRAKTHFPAAQRILMNQHVPDAWTADDLDAHHSLMKLHGQTFCPHGPPLCGACSLRQLCPTGRRGRWEHLGDDGPDEAYGSDERLECWPLGLPR